MSVRYLCSVPGCGRYREKGTRCATHAAQYERSDNARRSAKRVAHGRNTQHYFRVRKQVLARDKHCRYPGCRVSEGLHAHLDPAMQGRHDIAVARDYVALCARHHGMVDAPRARRSA